MQTLRTPIRVVLYQDEGVWFAHCLEFDLLGDGPTREAALKMLAQAIRIQIEATADFNNPTNLFTPAEGRFFTMFAAGAEVATSSLNLQLGTLPQIDLERVEVREFTTADAAAV